MTLEQLRTVFPVLEYRDCLDSEQSDLFYVNDPPENPCYIHRNTPTDVEEVKMFVVHNSNNEVNFVAVDRCLIQEQGQRTCDFILFDENKFAFIELKLNVTTRRIENADSQRTGALNQLFRTLLRFNTLFSDSGIDFLHPNIYIIVALPPQTPRNTASSKWISEFFIEKYGYDYEESRQIRFD